METNIVLEMPEGTTEENLPEGAAEVLEMLFRIKPGIVMPGTRPYNGKILHYTLLRKGLMNANDIQVLLDTFSLPWVNMGMQTALATTPAILDDEGNVLEAATPTVHVPLNAEGIRPYLVPSVDMQGVETPPSGYVQLSQYGLKGHIPWGIDLRETPQ